MDSGPGLIRLALFGAPVAHSLSPRIHAAFAQQAGLEVHYEAIETPAGKLHDSLEQFHDRGGVGCNVTLPLKREALRLAKSCSHTAQLAQAANTLSALPGSGDWHADNTDGLGLLQDLQCADWPVAGRRIAIAGAGGAAAGVLGALLEAGAAQVVIVNRDLDKAKALATGHAGLGDLHAVTWDDIGRISSRDLVVNATSLGHEGQVPPLDPALFGPNGACYDLNYGAAAGALRKWCADAGIPYRDGLGMLVGQAAGSFRIWTGFQAATAPVLARLREFPDQAPVAGS